MIRRIPLLLSPLLLAACVGNGPGVLNGDSGDSGTVQGLRTVFVVVMENHNWSDITESSSAPYINGTLLPEASYALNYRGPGPHPSEPNYLWLEAGDNFGIHNDKDPSVNHQSTTDHLVTQLEDAGLDWKSYQQGIDGTTCPLTQQGDYYPKHNPMIYFDDVTDDLDPSSVRCITHERPLDELDSDLSAGTVADYNFIVPDECHDMHNSCAPTNDKIQQGDDWLAEWVPKIMASSAYQDGGALFITWDEAELSFECPLANCPIGFIALSPLAKGGGYTNQIAYTHSSTLRTVEEIFGLPYLRDAQNATDLSDLFTVTP